MFFNKKENCPHGYPIIDEKTIPHRKTAYRIEACKKCSVKSAGSEMGMILDIDDEEITRLTKLLEAMRLSKC